MRKLSVCTKCEFFFYDGERRTTCEFTFNHLYKTLKEFLEEEFPEDCAYKLEHLVLDDEESFDDAESKLKKQNEEEKKILMGELFLYE